MRWRKIIGLSNLLAHGHQVIDVDELWDVAHHKVPEFLADLWPLVNKAD